jgi:hypothetical protein
MEINFRNFKALLFALAILVLSAFIKEKDLVGFYYSKDCLHNLTLLNDSTFEFKHHIGYQRSISTGTWRIFEEKYLILRSNYMDILNTPIKLSEGKRKEESDSIFLKLTLSS